MINPSQGSQINHILGKHYFASVKVVARVFTEGSRFFYVNTRKISAI